MTTSCPFAAPHRFITGHNEKGEATLLKWSGELPMIEGPTGGRMGAAWGVDNFPAEVNGDEDGGQIPVAGVVPKGNVVRYIDMPPDAHSPMHFTQSLDYAIVLKGVITMELTDGSFTEIKEGDFIAQRGTSHAWYNKSGEWARVVFIVMPAEKVLINGEPLKGNERK
ncbi:cupin domain protein [Meredithblackwellia eburnea MCA 4105]